MRPSFCPCWFAGAASRGAVHEKGRIAAALSGKMERRAAFPGSSSPYSEEVALPVACPTGDPLLPLSAGGMSRRCGGAAAAESVAPP